MAETSLGSRIRNAREAVGMSQAGLAERMSTMGHPWAQQTVGKIERGERDLKWIEGRSLESLIYFADSEGRDDQLVRDALAYRRILRVIGENEAVAE